jgi:hypothetical protein
MSQSVAPASAPIPPSPFASFQNGVDSTQQAVPVPWTRGTQKVPVIWASIVYNLNAQPTPSGKTKK